MPVGYPVAGRFIKGAAPGVVDGNDLFNSVTSVVDNGDSTVTVTYRDSGGNEQTQILTLGDDNVQSDWLQADDTQDDYIKNKPITITETPRRTTTLPENPNPGEIVYLTDPIINLNACSPGSIQNGVRVSSLDFDIADAPGLTSDVPFAYNSSDGYLYYALRAERKIKRLSFETKVIDPDWEIDLAGIATILSAISLSLSLRERTQTLYMTYRTITPNMTYMYVFDLTTRSRVTSAEITTNMTDFFSELLMARGQSPDSIAFGTTFISGEYLYWSYNSNWIGRINLNTNQADPSFNPPAAIFSSPAQNVSWNNAVVTPGNHIWVNAAFNFLSDVRIEAFSITETSVVETQPRATIDPTLFTSDLSETDPLPRPFYANCHLYWIVNGRARAVRIESGVSRKAGMYVSSSGSWKYLGQELENIQVPADWNQSDETQPSFIANKPSIPPGIRYMGRTTNLNTFLPSTAGLPEGFTATRVGIRFFASWGGTGRPLDAEQEGPFRITTNTYLGETGQYNSGSTQIFEDFQTRQVFYRTEESTSIEPITEFTAGWREITSQSSGGASNISRYDGTGPRPGEPEEGILAYIDNQGKFYGVSVETTHTETPGSVTGTTVTNSAFEYWNNIHDSQPGGVGNTIGHFYYNSTNHRFYQNQSFTIHEVTLAQALTYIDSLVGVSLPSFIAGSVLLGHFNNSAEAADAISARSDKNTQKYAYVNDSENRLIVITSFVEPVDTTTTTRSLRPAPLTPQEIKNLLENRLLPVPEVATRGRWLRQKEDDESYELADLPESGDIPSPIESPIPLRDESMSLPTVSGVAGVRRLMTLSGLRVDEGEGLPELVSFTDGEDVITFLKKGYYDILWEVTLNNTGNRGTPAISISTVEGNNLIGHTESIYIRGPETGVALKQFGYLYVPEDNTVANIFVENSAFYGGASFTIPGAHRFHIIRRPERDILTGPDIEANPSEDGTEALSKLKVGDTVYSLPRGGGGLNNRAGKYTHTIGTGDTAVHYTTFFITTPGFTGDIHFGNDGVIVPNASIPDYCKSLCIASANYPGLTWEGTMVLTYKNNPGTTPDQYSFMASTYDSTMEARNNNSADTRVFFRINGVTLERFSDQVITGERHIFRHDVYSNQANYTQTQLYHLYRDLLSQGETPLMNFEAYNPFSWSFNITNPLRSITPLFTQKNSLSGNGESGEGGASQDEIDQLRADLNTERDERTAADTQQQANLLNKVDRNFRNTPDDLSENDKDSFRDRMSIPGFDDLDSGFSGDIVNNLTGDSPSDESEIPFNKPGAAGRLTGYISPMTAGLRIIGVDDNVTPANWNLYNWPVGVTATYGVKQFKNKIYVLTNLGIIVSDSVTPMNWSVLIISSHARNPRGLDLFHDNGVDRIIFNSTGTNQVFISTSLSPQTDADWNIYPFKANRVLGTAVTVANRRIICSENTTDVYKLIMSNNLRPSSTQWSEELSAPGTLARVHSLDNHNNRLYATIDEVRETDRIFFTNSLTPRITSDWADEIGFDRSQQFTEAGMALAITGQVDNALRKMTVTQLNERVGANFDAPRAGDGDLVFVAEEAGEPKTVTDSDLSDRLSGFLTARERSVINRQNDLIELTHDLSVDERGAQVDRLSPGGFAYLTELPEGDPNDNIDLVWETLRRHSRTNQHTVLLFRIPFVTKVSNTRFRLVEGDPGSPKVDEIIVFIPVTTGILGGPFPETHNDYWFYYYTSQYTINQNYTNKFSLNVRHGTDSRIWTHIVRDNVEIPITFDQTLNGYDFYVTAATYTENVDHVSLLASQWNAKASDGTYLGRVQTSGSGDEHYFPNNNVTELSSTSTQYAFYWRELTYPINIDGVLDLREITSPALITKFRGKTELDSPVEHLEQAVGLGEHNFRLANEYQPVIPPTAYVMGRIEDLFMTNQGLIYRRGTTNAAAPVLVGNFSSTGDYSDGIFKSLIQYNHGGRHYLATTHYEPTGNRRAFVKVCEYDSSHATNVCQRINSSTAINYSLSSEQTRTGHPPVVGVIKNEPESSNSHVLTMVYLSNTHYRTQALSLNDTNTDIVFTNEGNHEIPGTILNPGLMRVDAITMSSIVGFIGNSFSLLSQRIFVSDFSGNEAQFKLLEKVLLITPTGPLVTQNNSDLQGFTFVGKTPDRNTWASDIYLETFDEGLLRKLDITIPGRDVNGNLSRGSIFQYDQSSSLIHRVGDLERNNPTDGQAAALNSLYKKVRKNLARFPVQNFQLRIAFGADAVGSTNPEGWPSEIREVFYEKGISTDTDFHRRYGIIVEEGAASRLYDDVILYINGEPYEFEYRSRENIYNRYRSKTTQTIEPSTSVWTGLNVQDVHFSTPYYLAGLTGLNWVYSEAK